MAPGAVAPEQPGSQITPAAEPEAASSPPVPMLPPAVAEPLETGSPMAAPLAEAQVLTSRAFLSGPALVAVGDEFVAEVLVEGMQNLYSAPLFVDYDANLLEFVQAEEGDFLKQGGMATVFTSTANPAAGKVIVGYKQGSDERGAAGSGKLFHLVFKAKAAGVASLGLDRLNFRDPDGNRLPVLAAGMTVEVR
jgi:general secretion pathway protein D